MEKVFKKNNELVSLNPVSTEFDLQRLEERLETDPSDGRWIIKCCDCY